MNNNAARVLTLAVVLAAIAVPIVFSIYIARDQTLRAEKSHLAAYAEDVQRRANAIADQADAGINTLTTDHARNPCSRANIKTMREVAVRYQYLQAIGYVSRGRLICSSLGRHGLGIELGPVDIVNPSGISMRTDVHFPFAPGISFLVIERDGYAALVHKSLPVDATTEEEGVSLATFALGNRKVLASKGVVKQEWINALGERREVVLTDDDYFVVVVRPSDRYLMGAVAALPLSVIDKRINREALWIVPVGAVAGILLALSVFHLAQLQRSIPSAIKRALRRNEFYLLYEPVIDLQTRRWVGAEALIRWRRDGEEPIMPNVFIPIAETVGLIQRITERVIEIVAREAVDIFRRHPDLHLAINLSASDLHSPRTIELLYRLMYKTHAGPGNLIVEATERGFLSFERARDVVHDIRATGIRTSIDDFGTGYSSLSYLEWLEIDFLKIDKSFIDTIGTDAPTSHVVLHIIELAKDLDLKMIAEGVETEVQAQFLRERGVQYAQGWLFGEPMSLADLDRQLAVQQGNAPASA